MLQTDSRIVEQSSKMLARFGGPVVLKRAVLMIPPFFMRHIQADIFWQIVQRRDSYRRLYRAMNHF